MKVLKRSIEKIRVSTGKRRVPYGYNMGSLPEPSFFPEKIGNAAYGCSFLFKVLAA